MSHDALRGLVWPMERLDHAVQALARRRGLTTPEGQVDPPPPPTDADLEGLSRWVQALVEARGLEAEPLETPYLELEAMLSGGGPALLRLPDNRGSFLALAGARRGQVALLSPRDLGQRWVPLDRVRAALCQDLEELVTGGVEDLLDRAGVRGRARARSRRGLLADQLREQRIGGTWLLRLPPGANFWQQLRLGGIPRRLWVYFGAHLSQYLLMMLAWWLVGRGALQGNLDRGWLWAWALLLLTMVPFQLVLMLTQGRITITLGAALKQRLLHGAMCLEPEEVKHQGAGQTLGRVMETGAVESMALGAGFKGVVALMELALAGSVLALGAGGAYHVLLLGLWVLLILALSWRFYRRTGRWTDARLSMTHDLVERMVGHRTRLAQERPERWHEGEDEALETYMERSARLDSTAIQLSGLVQRGWLLLALAFLTPAFVNGSGVAVTAIAVSLGGIMLASGALGKVEGSVSALAMTLVSWRQVRQLYHAAARDAGPRPAAASASRPARRGEDGEGDAPTPSPLLQAHGLFFGYRPEAQSVLRGCDLSIYPGDRVLLQGGSGGGKSTLASLLVGLRAQQSGLLLLDGLDLKSLGRVAWRRRVAAAPQFHENHVLTGTFAFNLLMGRSWPPSAEDLEDAQQVCQELGLSDLLERMPAGLNQVVGDTGWRLSHGERSRVFIARALLQGADMVVLDESFAALDPESLALALQCVLTRAPTLLVIAHP